MRGIEMNHAGVASLSTEAGEVVVNVTVHVCLQPHRMTTHVLDTHGTATTCELVLSCMRNNAFTPSRLPFVTATYIEPPLAPWHQSVALALTTSVSCSAVAQPRMLLSSDHVGQCSEYREAPQLMDAAACPTCSRNGHAHNVRSDKTICKCK